MESEQRATYYEQMAAGTRANAETMTDFSARQTMLEVAALWEVMAATAKRAANPPNRAG